MTKPYSIGFTFFFAVLFLGILSPLFVHWLTPSVQLPSLYPAPAFEMTDSRGEQFSSESLSGKVWVANFFFTSCKGPCPVQSQSIATLAERFAGKNARFVSISVDPERDTPERLAEYAERFNADTSRWHLLHGEKAAVDRLLNEGFKLGSVDDPIYHSTRFVLVDSSGMIRGYYQGTSAEEVKNLERAMRSLL